MTNCNQCPYNICGRIPAQTPFKTDLVICGMAPGSEELKKQAPFQGRSGKLLRETLLKAGLNENYFITNALLCKPLNDNNVSKVAIKLCRDRLIKEVKACNPRFIIALGNVAINSLQNDKSLKIGSIHSMPMPWTEDTSIQIIPIFHPAKILRSIGDYHTFLNGFIYTKQLLNKGKKKDPGITHFTIINQDNVEEITQFIINFSGIISCDIETTSLNPRKAEILAIGFGYDKNKVIIFPGMDFLPYIKSIFRDSCAKFVYHRSQFDTAVLNEVFKFV